MPETPYYLMKTNQMEVGLFEEKKNNNHLSLSVPCILLFRAYVLWTVDSDISTQTLKSN